MAILPLIDGYTATGLMVRLQSEVSYVALIAIAKAIELDDGNIICKPNHMQYKEVVSGNAAPVFSWNSITTV